MPVGLHLEEWCSPTNIYDVAVSLGVRRERDTKGPHGKKEDSNAKKKGHETRTKNVLDKKWEEGTKFDAKQNKYRAKKESEASP